MKTVFYTYITILILLAVLPINGTNSILNNNYLLNIRWDYLLHALVYIPLVPIAHRSFSVGGNIKHRTRNTKLGTLNTLTISLIFAFSLEGVQYFLSYRAFNINDMVANGIGVGLGYLIVIAIMARRGQAQFKYKN